MKKVLLDAALEEVARGKSIAELRALARRLYRWAQQLFVACDILAGEERAKEWLEVRDPGRRERWRN